MKALEGCGTKGIRLTLYHAPVDPHSGKPVPLSDVFKQLLAATAPPLSTLAPTEFSSATLASRGSACRRSNPCLPDSRYSTRAFREPFLDKLVRFLLRHATTE
jgi:hypothetical protein